MIVNRYLSFDGPKILNVREETLLRPAPGEILVESVFSAVSTGSEILAYRGEFPEVLELDGSLPGVSAPCSHPLRYGYSTFGRVAETGEGVTLFRKGDGVFCFRPHQLRHVLPAAEVIPVPADIPPEGAAMLANAETAVGLVMDAAPVAGENAMVIGLGVVGLFTAWLLRQNGMIGVSAVDPSPFRRGFGSWAGLEADRVYSEVRDCGRDCPGGIDLTIEVSGNPSALDAAIRTAADFGRIVVGSWYGGRRASLDLGSDFHRKALRIVSSQVSRIAPEHSGRFDKVRRFGTAWELIRRSDPRKLVTMKTPLSGAPEAYRVLEAGNSANLQVLIDYQAGE